MNRIYAILLLVAACLGASAAEISPAVLDSVLTVLDSELARAPQYDADKEARIATLRSRLNSEKSARAKFEICRQIHGEYRVFQYDSASVYARKMLSLADAAGDKAGKAIALMALAECYTNVGFFKEASEAKARIVEADLPADVRPEYYALCSKLYQQLESYVKSDEPLSEEYSRLRDHYYRLLADSVSPDNCIRRSAELDYEYKTDHDVDRAYAQRLEFLNTMTHDDEHEKAVCHSILGTFATIQGKRDDAAYHYALSAIHDIRTATHETTAAKDLANNMYRRGDIQRANKYIHHALDDARHFNSRLRIVEINTVLPHIESTRYSIMDTQRRLLVLVVALIAALVALLVVFLTKLRNRNERLARSHARIAEQAAQLEQAIDNLNEANFRLKDTNERLQETNARLKEANEIKDQYIVQSLMGNPDFINSVEQKCRKAISKLKARQYDELSTILYEMGVKRERERMYSSFDNAFLRLFPNFIEEFNKLFPPDAQFSTGDKGELPTELRIFALMRLGLDNAAEVARYLNVSVNTVYVYKTKIKARSMLDKQEFDQAVMAIPKP